jgi:NTP pyrophosphatase (non-canonical NTP hydrolase)
MKNIEIEEKKYELLSERANRKGFESTEEYIDDILQQIIDKIRKEQEETSEKVKQKLKDLGYTD